MGRKRARPLIDPGRPANSYLLYKLLLRPENFRSPLGQELTPDEQARRDACTPGYRAALPVGETLPASRDELERLRDWFVRGEGMPLATRASGETPSPVTLDALHELQSFIAHGASCP
jgi:hypothetical protein